MDEYALCAHSTKRRSLSKHELLFAVPFVRGYALKTKKWLMFFITNILPIKFNGKASASHALPAERKDLILAFIASQVKRKISFDNLIAGKGLGTILMLSGPVKKIKVE